MKTCFLFAYIILIISLSCQAYAIDAGTDGGSQDIQITADTPPILIKSVKPSYPADLIKDYKEGRVVIKFTVNSEGRVEDPSIIESTPAGIFDEYALAAVKQYYFQSATADGKSIACIVNMPMEFNLKEAGTEKEVITGYDAYIEAEKGVNYTSKGEYDLAIEAFTRAIEIYDNYSSAYCGRGIAYIEKGDYAKAMADLDEAIKLDPDKAIYYKYRGRLYAFLGDNRNAINNFNEAIRIDKEMAEVYNSRGDAYRTLGEYTRAIEDYTKVINTNPSYIQAYNNRAYSYNKLKDSVNTCKDLKKACDLGDCRGWDIFKKGNKCEEKK